MSPEREAKASVSDAPSTISDSSARLSVLSSPKTRRDVERKGLR